MLSYILITLDLGAVLSARVIQTILLDFIKALHSVDNIHKLAIRSQSA
jgi:hypothetical protein